MHGSCLLLVSLLSLFSQAESGGEDAVEKIRQQLGPSLPGMPARFPWYDVEKDEIVPLIPPAPPKQYDWPWKGLFDSMTSIANVTLTALMWLLGGCLVAGIAFLLFKALRDRSHFQPVEVTEAADLIDRIEELPIRLSADSDFFSLASRFVSEGRLREAVIYYFSHQLLVLDKAGVIRLARGKTNRRYLREVGESSDELLRLFSPSVKLFEDVFFGQVVVDPIRFEQVWQHREQFAQLLEAKS